MASPDDLSAHGRFGRLSGVESLTRAGVASGDDPPREVVPALAIETTTGHVFGLFSQPKHLNKPVGKDPSRVALGYEWGLYVPVGVRGLYLVGEEPYTGLFVLSTIFGLGTYLTVSMVDGTSVGVTISYTPEGNYLTRNTNFDFMQPLLPDGEQLPELLPFSTNLRPLNLSLAVRRPRGKLGEFEHWQVTAGTWIQVGRCGLFRVEDTPWQNCRRHEAELNALGWEYQPAGTEARLEPYVGGEIAVTGGWDRTFLGRYWGPFLSADLRRRWVYDLEYIRLNQQLIEEAELTGEPPPGADQLYSPPQRLDAQWTLSAILGMWNKDKAFRSGDYFYPYLQVNYGVPIHGMLRDNAEVLYIGVGLTSD